MYWKSGGGACRNPGVNSDPAIGIAARRPVNLLVDHGIDAAIAGKSLRQSVVCGRGERQAVGAIALVVEFAEMMPAAGSPDAGESARVGFLVEPVLDFRDRLSRASLSLRARS
jgi:hypothetical protein